MKKESGLIVILGPTATGKSSLAIKLAKKFNGEIISADSRQVYKGLNIGSGKISKKEQKSVPHHLLSIVDPKKQFTVSTFKRKASSAIKKISKKGKLPFVVGGSAFYIYALVDDLNIPEVKPNQKLRRQLANKSTKELFSMLKKLDARRAKSIDPHNPVRLIRAIEIVKSTGRPVPALTPLSLNPSPQGGGKEKILPPPRWGRLGEGGETLILGIKKDSFEIRKLIDNRVDDRLKIGMVAEVKKLLKLGVSHKRLQQFGLEYRFISLYLQNKLTYNQMVDQLKSAIHKFSKRQMTWFKRDKRIKWITNQKQAETLAKRYLLVT